MIASDCGQLSQLSILNRSYLLITRILGELAALRCILVEDGGYLFLMPLDFNEFLLLLLVKQLHL